MILVDTHQYSLQVSPTTTRIYYGGYFWTLIQSYDGWTLRVLNHHNNATIAIFSKSLLELNLVDKEATIEDLVALPPKSFMEYNLDD